MPEMPLTGSNETALDDDPEQLYTGPPPVVARNASANLSEDPLAAIRDMLIPARQYMTAIIVIAAAICMVVGYLTHEGTGLAVGLVVGILATWTLTYVPSAELFIALLPNYIAMILQRMKDIPTLRVAVIAKVTVQLASLDVRTLASFLREATNALAKEVRSDKRKALAQTVVSAFLPEVGLEAAAGLLTASSQENAIAALSTLPKELLAQLAGSLLTGDPSFAPALIKALSEADRTRLVVSLGTGSGNGSVSTLLDTATSILPSPSAARDEFISAIGRDYTEYLRLRKLEVEKMVAELIAAIKSMHHNGLESSGELSVAFLDGAKEHLARLAAMVVEHDLEKNLAVNLELELASNQLQQIDSKMVEVAEEPGARDLYAKAKLAVEATIGQIRGRLTSLTASSQVTQAAAN